MFHQRTGAPMLAAAAVFLVATALAPEAYAAQDLPVRLVVIDPSGAKVPAAQVRVFQARTGSDALVETLHSDQSGELLLTLPAGDYTVQISAPGFQDAQQAIATGGALRSPVLVRLRIAAKAETVDVAGSDADDGSVADGQALILRGGQLAALSSDPNLLQQEINSLVQTDDGSAPQLRVDGFSNGRLPPKSAIREIRINQNAYSAQFDQRGNSVVDIFTRPGGEKLQGSVYLSGNADPLNARNPYLPTTPSYHSVYLDANLNGALSKRTSFFVGSTVNDLQNSAAVLATVVDANFNIVPFSQTVADPLLTRSANLRIDHQFGERNTLTARAEWSGTHQSNAGLGLGQLVLPSAAYTADLKTFAVQLGNSTVVSPTVVLESRFQYRRTWAQQLPNSTDAAVVVQGGFTGGGSTMQGLRDVLDNYEWQEYASFDRGRHFLRAGVRYRLTRDSNSSTAQFNGQYTFASIAAYQATVRGLAQGQTPAQIRAAGGGASQYNVTAGRPGAVITTGDLGLYFEDEWKVSPNFSLTSGLRYESQFGIPDHNDPAPRLGFTLTVPGRKGTPLFRLRGGVGFFYDRFAAGDILTAARQNGVLQQTYYLQNPDTFPARPLPAALGGNASSVYQIAPGYHSPYVLGEGVTLERALLGGRSTLTFTREHGTHGLLSRNANAPLNGVRPLGGSQNVYQFASLGTSDTTTLAPNFTRRLGKFGTLWVQYFFRFRSMAGFGADSFVSNSYDIAADYGRTPSVTRHRATVTGVFNLPWNFSSTAYLSLHSATRFNVTTGQDNNGDSIFNDRPSFATDLSQPSVVRTAIGNFNTAPGAGQRPIPIDYGVGPGVVSLQGQLGREFVFGPRVAAEPAAPGAKASPPDRFFHCFLGASVSNAFNHVNRSTPIGQLTSPNFGKSLTLNPEVTQVTSANRVVNLFLSFRF